MEDREDKLYYLKSMAQSMSVPNQGLKHIGDMMQWAVEEIERLRRSLDAWERMRLEVQKMAKLKSRVGEF